MPTSLMRLASTSNPKVPVIDIQLAATYNLQISFSDPVVSYS